MKASKEIKIGLTVIVAIAFLIFGINYLKGVNIFKNNRSYYAKYDQIDGLVTASPVVFNGMKVGQVIEIEIKEGGEYILVTFVIDNDDIKIPVDSKATIFSSDLLGTRAINLQLGESKKFASPGDVLVGTTQQSLGERVDQEIAPIKQKAQELLGSIDTLVTVIHKVVGDNKSGLDASIASFQRTIKSLEASAKNIEAFVDEERGKLSVTFNNVKVMSSNLVANSENLNNIMTNISKVSGDLAKTDMATTYQKINDAFDNINSLVDKINRGEGSLGMLINSDSLHNALIATNAKVQNLLDNFILHPNRYLHFSVFGAKEKGLKLTADEEKRLRDLLKQQPS